MNSTIQVLEILQMKLLDVNIAIQRQPRRFDVVFSELKTYSQNILCRVLIFSELREFDYADADFGNQNDRERIERRLSVNFFLYKLSDIE